jgi:hypothetical protein
MVKRASWLSVTPEPERELPHAVASLVVRGRPSEGDVTRERERIERLVLRGSQRSWLAYLHEVVGLIGATTAAAAADADVARARERARAVIANHHNLLLGLPGRGAAMTAGDRAALQELDPDVANHHHKGTP